MWRVVGDAQSAARYLHRDQVRKFDGEPYFQHPLRVSHLVARAGAHENVVAAALLHDTIEDCDVTADHLCDVWGIPQEVVDLVVVLTRTDAETHAEYMDRVVQNPDAWLIKRADVLDNLSTLPPGHGLTERYIKALLVLHATPPRFMEVS